MQARDAQEKARKKAAISKLNRIFGIPADADAAPTESQFYSPGTTVVDPNYVNPGLETLPPEAYISVGGGTDTAAFQKALDAYFAQDEEAKRNKVARDADYTRVGSDVKSFHMDRLAKDLEKVVRAMKFNLLGSGNWGGSGELDERANLDETRNRGVMDIQNLSDSTADSVKAADTDKLTSLVAAVNAGMEEADAANAATAHTSTSAQRAIQGAKGASFANLFDDLMGSYQMRAANRGTGRANDFYAQRQLASVPGSSGGSYSGAYSRS